jgi:hypothetical protein
MLRYYRRICHQTAHNTVSLTGVFAEIQTKCLPNTSSKHYHYTSLLGILLFYAKAVSMFLITTTNKNLVILYQVYIVEATKRKGSMEM